MITGTVTANGEPMIRLTVRGASGQEQEVEAIVDTGFNGFLTLPLDLLTALGCSRISDSRLVLPDGREEFIGVYEATVVWDGRPRVVEIDGASLDILVGMEMLHGHELRIEVVGGGAVTINPLP